MDKKEEKPKDPLGFAFSELGNEISKNKLGGLNT